MAAEDERNVLTEEYIQEPTIRMAASSIIGTRKYQQDSYGCIETPMGCLATICDGMGGLQGGERASALAVRMLLKDYLGFRGGDIRSFFRNEAVSIDTAVNRLTDEYGTPLGAGSTLAAVHVKDGRMSWISVGDSKIYVIRDGKLNCIVREHNYRLLLNEMYQQKKITPEQYHEEEKDAEALISYMGMGNVSLMDTEERPLKLLKKDMVLICSDGLYRSLTDRQMEAIMEDNYFDLNRAVCTLTSSALQYARGSQDNTTAVLLRYE